VRRPPAYRLLLLAALAAVGTGCSTTRPGGSIVTPTASQVVGKVPNPNANIKGNPAAGKVAFTNNGCGSCHTFTPAGASGKVGPDLNKLAAEAAAVHQPVATFARTQIVTPDTFRAPGYPVGVMPKTFASLPPQTIADLVTFLTQGH
jgi:mono/diheme cytochrome c family protein